MFTSNPKQYIARTADIDSLMGEINIRWKPKPDGSKQQPRKKRGPSIGYIVLRLPNNKGIEIYVVSSSSSGSDDAATLAKSINKNFKDTGICNVNVISPSAVITHQEMLKKMGILDTTTAESDDKTCCERSLIFKAALDGRHNKEADIIGMGTFQLLYDAEDSVSSYEKNNMCKVCIRKWEERKKLLRGQNITWALSFSESPKDDPGTSLRNVIQEIQNARAEEKKKEKQRREKHKEQEIEEARRAEEATIGSLQRLSDPKKELGIIADLKDDERIRKGINWLIKYPYAAKIITWELFMETLNQTPKNVKSLYEDFVTSCMLSEFFKSNQISTNPSNITPDEIMKKLHELREKSVSSSTIVIDIIQQIINANIFKAQKYQEDYEKYIKHNLKKTSLLAIHGMHETGHAEIITDMNSKEKTIPLITLSWDEKVKLNNEVREYLMNPYKDPAERVENIIKVFAKAQDREAALDYFNTLVDSEAWAENSLKLWVHARFEKKTDPKAMYTKNNDNDNDDENNNDKDNNNSNRKDDNQDGGKDNNNDNGGDDGLGTDNGDGKDNSFEKYSSGQYQDKIADLQFDINLQKYKQNEWLLLNEEKKLASKDKHKELQANQIKLNKNLNKLLRLILKNNIDKYKQIETFKKDVRRLNAYQNFIDVENNIIFMENSQKKWEALDLNTKNNFFTILIRTEKEIKKFTDNENKKLLNLKGRLLALKKNQRLVEIPSNLATTRSLSGNNSLKTQKADNNNLKKPHDIIATSNQHALSEEDIQLQEMINLTNKIVDQEESQLKISDDNDQDTHTDHDEHKEILFSLDRHLEKYANGDRKVKAREFLQRSNISPEIQESIIKKKFKE